MVMRKSAVGRSVSRREFMRLAGAGLVAGPVLAACAGGEEEAVPAAGGGAQEPVELSGELNVLAWDGYDNPDVVRGFEEQFGVTLNVKIHGDNAAGAAQLEAEPGRWDVIDVDNDWYQRLAKQGLVQPLDRSEYPHLEEMWPPFQNFPAHHYEGELYAVPTRFGINGIVYLPGEVDGSRLTDADYLWDPSLEGKISIIDWFDLYILLVALYEGNKEPWTATGDELERIKQRLIELKPNIRAIHTSLGDVINDLAQGNVPIVWGSSSSDTTIGLNQEGVPAELVIPEQGAALWTEGLGIIAGSQNVEAAKAYLNYMTSPEVMAMMAWNDQFKVEVCNSRVVEFLTDEQIEALKLDEAVQWFENPNIVLSQTPVDLEGWEAVWEEFKSA